MWVKQKSMKTGYRLFYVFIVYELRCTWHMDSEVEPRLCPSSIAFAVKI